MYRYAHSYMYVLLSSYLAELVAYQLPCSVVMIPHLFVNCINFNDVVITTISLIYYKQEAQEDYYDQSS